LRVVTDPAFLASSIAAGAQPGPNNLDNADGVETTTRYNNRGVSLASNLQIGAHTLTAITAYRELYFHNDVPVDYEPNFNYLPANVGAINAHKFSQELRLTSPSTGKI